MNLTVVNSLYRKGLIYLDVTIDDNDCIIGKILDLFFFMNYIMYGNFAVVMVGIFCRENTVNV